MLGYLFRKFNAVFNLVDQCLCRRRRPHSPLSAVVLVVYGGLLYMTWWSFEKAPSGFIPMQDKGYLLVNVQLPDAASVQRTMTVMSRIEKIAHETPGVKHTVTVAGQSILLGADSPNFGACTSCWTTSTNARRRAKRAENRRTPWRNAFATISTTPWWASIKAPPVDGLGTAGGFKIVIEDRSSNGLAALQGATERIVDAGRDKPDELRGMFSSFRADTPWLFLDINRDQAKTLGLAVNDVFTSLQVFLGSLYVNDLNWFGRTWQVNVQSESRFRRDIADIKQLSVRNAAGQMVPLSTIANVRAVSER